MTRRRVDPAALRGAPKVLLHDHLDGGLRPATLLELADAAGHRLPVRQPAALAGWFRGAAHSGSLPRYLQTFGHTVGVLQTADALRRVAAECVADLAADGVVYAEVRFAPELHTAGGLAPDAVVEAVLDGLRAGPGPRVGLLLTAMRGGRNARSVAELALRHRDGGVVGFDIAGPEAGHPPTEHQDAFDLLRRESMRFTIHAGEGFGLPSIRQALQRCGADRLGHGVRLADDVTVSPDGAPTLGRLAAFVRDTRVPLELCPSSNVHTGAVASLAEHPIGLLADLRFRVTVNTDNRLMSGCTPTSELAALVATFGWGWPELLRVTLNAAKSAFLDYAERRALIEDVIVPRYAALAREDVPWP